MAMRKQITSIGNSAGIILDKPLLRLLGLEVGSEVELAISEDRTLLLRPVAARTAVREHARRVMRKQDKTFRKLAE